MQSILAESAPTFWLPGGASTVSGQVDYLFNVILWICIFFFFLVSILLVLFTVMYRHKPGQTHDTAAGHSTALELTWTLIPSVIVVFLYYYGFRHYMDMTIEPAYSYEVTAVGKMWQWSFRYPTGLEANELHVPINTPIRAVLTSNDVIHSLYIPAFRVKKDVVPGRFNRMWFQATDSNYVVYATSAIIDGKLATIAVDSDGKPVNAESDLTPKFGSEKFSKLSPGVQTALGDVGAKYTGDELVNELQLCNGSAIYITTTTSGASPTLSMIDGGGNQLKAGSDFGSLPASIQAALKSEAHGDIPAAQPIQVFLDAQPYDIYCAGYCGTNHSIMRSRVIVHRTQADFDSWLKVQTELANNLPPVQKGEKLYRTQGCAQCHSIDGSKLVGPSWRDMWGRTENITGGPQIVVDAPYVKESILLPQAKIVEGFPPSMPPFALKDADIDALMAYMKSISSHVSEAEKMNLNGPAASQPAGGPATQPASAPAEK